ncbi:phage terminase small subunit [Holdemania massiliensis]|uniref:phage terminase small subunit n=1 Tax=Holdemania massiliensis TaxID=1468449 RepID=UPI001F054859|nr:phage terminase small subunit [Holdemania massiliensis]
MPKKPDPRIEIAKELYLQGMKLVEIASQLELPEGTVRRWKCTHKWDNERSDKNQANVRKKRGGQPGNHNATGPPGNQNARKHGLFARYVQPDIREIMEDVKKKDKMELLMEAIEFWYSKIIKAQQIMYVEDHKAMTREVVVEGAESTAYDIQYAWDKQATEIKALSRAFSELRGLLKTYDELSKSEQAKEEREQRIQLIKAQVKKIQEDPENSKSGSKVVIVNDLDQVESEDRQAE